MKELLRLKKKRWLMKYFEEIELRGLFYVCSVLKFKQYRFWYFRVYFRVYLRSLQRNNNLEYWYERFKILIEIFVNNRIGLHNLKKCVKVVVKKLQRYILYSLKKNFVFFKHGVNS